MLVLPVRSLLSLLLLSTVQVASARRDAAVDRRASAWRTVSTTEGPVQGLYSKGVYRWLGIPYAASTSGSNRFMPAASPNKRSSVFSATKFGKACPQLISQGTLDGILLTDNTAPGPSGQGEDCLSLNIWAKASTRHSAQDVLAGKQKGAAVMLYIYGGSFVWGSTTSPAYNGQKLIENQDDIIIVTFNYRLNILGFPRAPQLQNANSSWNYGLTDRDAAIDWVRNNIAQFGGDRNRITLFGQSAGGASADLWAFSHANGEPGSDAIAGIIVQSGAVSAIDILISAAADPAPNDQSSTWNTVAAAVGCPKYSTANATAQFSCMQKVPWTSLIKPINDKGLVFGPAPDQKTFFNDLTWRSQFGQVNPVPMIFGSNTHEGTVFGTPASNSSLSASDADNLITDPVFTCGAAVEADDRRHNGMTAFRYQYDGNWANINSGLTILQAYHFAEVPMIFGNFDDHPLGNKGGKTVGPTTVVVPSAQYNTSQWFQSMWTTFAKDPVNGLPSKGWPLYNVYGPTIAKIAANNSGVVSYQGADVSAAFCKFGSQQKRDLIMNLRNHGVNII